MQFPNFITLPLEEEEEDWWKVLTQSYFIQEQSWVEYYR